MERPDNRFILLLTVLSLWNLVSACSSSRPVEIVQVTPRIVLTQTPTSTKTPDITATNTTSPTSPPTTRPLERPSETPIPTNFPSPTPTINPSLAPPLAIQEPTIDDIEQYLADLSLREDFYGFVIEMLKADVNGDGLSDLVVSDFLFVGVFIRQGDFYIPAYIDQRYPWKYDPGSRIFLEDWTNDGTPEVIFEYRQDTGGTGSRITEWNKTVIHCPKAENSCRVIWQGDTGSLSEYGSGTSRESVITELVNNGNTTGNPKLEVYSESFAIMPFFEAPAYAPKIGDGILSFPPNSRPDNFAEQYYMLDSHIIYSSTLETFVWNEFEFELQSSDILTKQQVITSTAILEATNSSGQSATISTQFNNSAEGRGDSCQIYMDGKAIGKSFGCKRNFTVVGWQDIVGDESEELIVTTVSGLYVEDGFLIGEECVHQRLIAFYWQGTQFTEIANFFGCVVKPNLYGVRVMDINSDGQVEIIAAKGLFTAPRCFSMISFPGQEQENCWYELGHKNVTYSWNGVEFVQNEILSD